MKQFLKFLTKLKSYWKLYQNYGYEGETVEFIINNYERVLCNRTKTMSKPTYYLEDVLRKIDNWYEDMMREISMENKNLIEEIITTIEKEFENSNHTEYRCVDDSVIHTDVGYVEGWFNEYKDILRKRYCE